MTEVTGYILIGGASRRMGTDKSKLVFGSLTLAERAAVVLDKIADSVKVVGGSLEGWETVPDRNATDTRASIYGMHAALADCRTEWAAVLACDMPFVSANLFQVLLAETDRPNTDAVVPVQPDGRPQPLAAIYRTSRCLPVVESLIFSGELRLTSMFEKLDTVFLQPPQYGLVENLSHHFLNVNTPDDLRLAEEIAERFDE